MQVITVAAATKEPKFFNNEKFWGVKVGNTWMDLYGVESRPGKGQTFQVEIDEVESNGKIYRHARPVKGAQPAQDPLKLAPSPQPRPAQALNGNRATSYTQTFDTYAEVARRAHAIAVELEPAVGAERARFTLVSTFLIALGDGKLAIEPGGEWEDVAPGQPTKYERCAAHDALWTTIREYCEREGETPEGASSMLREVSGTDDLLELSEKQAIQARLKAEAIIDAATDYKKLFTEAAKAQAKKEGWDLASKDPKTAEKKAGLLRACGITVAWKDVTNAQARAALRVLESGDDIPF